MILPVILDWTSDDELLANAFCSADIITRPGTRNAAYGTASYIRVRPSMTWLKMNRKRTPASTAAPIAWVLTFQKARTSLWNSVGNPPTIVAYRHRSRLRDRVHSVPFLHAATRPSEST